MAKDFVILQNRLPRKVISNAQDKRYYDKKSGLRNIFLEGEAYFEVAKNEKAPFIVNTSKIKVKVLGTSFNIKCYPEDKTIETTLIEGKVTIQQAGETVAQKQYYLNPNQKAVYDKNNHTFVFEDLVVNNEIDHNINVY